KGGNGRMILTSPTICFAASGRGLTETLFMSELVKTEVVDRVLIITINRPEARNAINYETALAMAEVFDRLDTDDSLALGILTGAGGTFSSGMDLKAFAATGQRPLVEGRGFGGLCEKAPRKPLIAAVEGYALAGG